MGFKTAMYLLLMSLYLNCAKAKSGPDKPNIVFVFIDDYGWNDIGYHNHKMKTKTPTLDSLAAEGVKLENYYVAPTCTPSHGQFLSGRYSVGTFKPVKIDI